MVYVLLFQVVMIGAMPDCGPGSPSGWASFKNDAISAGPFAGLSAAIGLGGLATFLRIDAFISPSGTGADLH